MEPLLKLQTLGYQFKIEGENIRYKLVANKTPDLALVNSLLDELKARKQEALEYLRTQNKEKQIHKIEAFDPDGYLETLLSWARKHDESDYEVTEWIDDIIKDQVLNPPWGIKIKNSPILGDYWIVSDNEAKKRVPDNEIAFTQDCIQLLADIREIFGIATVEVKKRK
jgi:hypothetical protein